MEMHSQPSSPNKRIKTLTPNPPSYISKGKSKIQDQTSSPCNHLHKVINDKELSDCCGICLSEPGNGGGVSRGYIDSCNHYFCFVCIMEWAKVESKCPLCKRRFSTIRRPPKPPIFTSDRLVHVPVRDQVYHYNGNSTIGLTDPYLEIKCSVCQGITDESLLLLCDLCDSAAHTYCVGLGVTVPESDWFCQDCTLLRAEHTESETNADSGVQINFDTSHKILSANEHVSVSDIVQEPCGHAVHKSRSIFSDRSYLMPPSSTNDEISMVSNISRLSSRSLEIAAQCPTKTNARTLRHCRNLHDRIRVLRENWSGFRSGILCFSFSPGDGNISSQKSITCASGRRSVSCLNQQSTAQCGSTGIPNDTGAHDIHKAWKMMDKAKSVKQSRERSSIVHQASKCPIRRLNTIRNADYMSHGLLSSNGQENGPGHHHNYTLEKDCYKEPSSLYGKQKWRRQVTEGVKNHSEGSLIGKHQGLESYNGVQTPSYIHSASVRNDEKLPAEKSFKGPSCLSSSVVSRPVPNIDLPKEVNHTSSSHSKVKHLKEKSKSEKICVDRKLYDDAKSEIQSLVKLNLKLQSTDEKLEADSFKEVARLATHSILAACGMEHPKTVYCSFPGFVCSHPSEVRQLQKSGLMPNCCRECFYVFVKDTVNTVMLLKKKTHVST
ncbi:hypothetical protein BUALT_Bualt02G0074300 [Buddleja alternifolia]|uniref:PHD and RING finger domain-containing protein 1 n=1 Tax=Buddleja alternifolia TaxID=168488 RepID=A0AAV6XZU3_9LAMI|nr:hypothetical protein BUALT_Bualt02G0074300 [Buddleja alternifolia]